VVVVQLKCNLLAQIKQSQLSELLWEKLLCQWCEHLWNITTTIHSTSMARSRPNCIIYFFCIKKLPHLNRLEAHYKQLYPITLAEGLLLDRTIPPVGWYSPAPAGFNVSRCTWIIVGYIIIY
jgi:hypothetical protein